MLLQLNGDGGDAAADTGRLYIWKWITAPGALTKTGDWQDYKKVLGFIAPCPLILNDYVRYPIEDLKLDPDGKWKDPKNYSRDQEVSNVIAMGLYNLHDRLISLFWHRVKSFGFMPNKDLIMPQHWGAFIRGLKWKRLSWSLYLSDCFLYLQSYFLRWVRVIKPDHVAPDLNYTCLLIQSSLVFPTFISRAAIRNYKKADPQAAWDKYHSSEWATPLNELYKPLITELLES